jgi:glycosyl transferase family 25
MGEGHFRISAMSDLPPCFVVSLKRSLDRRAHIAAEFAREGVPFAFIDAIDAMEINPQRITSPSLGHPLVAGDIACTMSHGRAMQTMLDQGYDRAIIFEDDATLIPGFLAATDALLAANVRWDFLKLCGPPIALANFVRHERFTFVWPHTPSVCCPGYIITSAGARKLVPLTDPALDVFDHILRQPWKTKLELVEVVPRLVGWMGSSMPSTIGRGEQYNRDSLASKFRRRLYGYRRSIWKRLRI